MLDCTSSTFLKREATIFMRAVILKCKSAQDLWEFKMITKANCVEINLRDCTLICDYDEAEIEFAIKEYKAQVEQHEVTS